MQLAGSPPVLMAPRPDGIEVVWSVTEPARGWVEWATGDDSPRTAAMDTFGFVPQGTEVLRVRIDGWAPGTDYRLRTVTVAAADGRREVSGWKRVRTLDPGAPTSSFVVWNDTHQRAETLTQLDEASPQADVWVWNGDICNDWKDADEIIPTALNPAGRDVTDGRPLAFVWGNHDVRGPWAYRLPEVIATPDGRPYYAIRSGPVAAIVLNTGEDKPDDHPSFGGRVGFQELRRRQAIWLAEQVRRPGFVDAPYRIVFCHLPLRWHAEPVLGPADYASGEFDHYARTSRELWHDALVEWGAQVVISGHTHRSELIPASPEFPYVQVTGGGPDPAEATWIGIDADQHRMSVATHRLDGAIAHQVDFRPF